MNANARIIFRWRRSTYVGFALKWNRDYKMKIEREIHLDRYVLKMERLRPQNILNYVYRWIGSLVISLSKCFAADIKRCLWNILDILEWNMLIIEQYARRTGGTLLLLFCFGFCLSSFARDIFTHTHLDSYTKKNAC